MRGELTDAVTMHDYDRVASLFTPDGAVRMPRGNGRRDRHLRSPAFFDVERHRRWG